MFSFLIRSPSINIDNFNSIGSVGNVGNICTISNICNIAIIGDISNTRDIVYLRKVPEGCFEKIFGKFFSESFFSSKIF